MLPTTNSSDWTTKTTLWRRHGRCRGNVGDHERAGSDAVSCQLAAGIEAEPTEPENTGAKNGERKIMGRRNFFGIPFALADKQREDECRDAGIDVNDRATGKVKRPHGAEKPAAPDPMAHRIVDQRCP